MPRGAYEALRDEERALPLAAAAAACVAFATVTAVGISLGIVFPAEPADRPFCRERRMLEALPAAASSREEEPEAYRYRGGAFYMTTVRGRRLLLDGRLGAIRRPLRRIRRIRRLPRSRWYALPGYSECSFRCHIWSHGNSLWINASGPWK